MTVNPLAALIAEELRSLSIETEFLAATLCADGEIASKYLDVLQQFDLLAQSQGELADLLTRLAAGTDACTALKSIRLAGMAQRLAKAS